MAVTLSERHFDQQALVRRYDEANNNLVQILEYGNARDAR
jgi:hypothetical protein